MDGLYDLVIQTAVDTPPNMLISIAESPDSFSYPTQEVWRDTAGPPLVLPISAYDIDQDGFPEIVKDIKVEGGRSWHETFRPLCHLLTKSLPDFSYLDVLVSANRGFHCAGTY